VFTFDAIDLDSTANITVTGHRALALLSHGNAMIDTTIDVSGGSGLPSAPFPAGIGRAGGFDGGFGTAAGLGPGGGSSATVVSSNASAAGGSFGSQGAPGIPIVGVAAQPGPAYGDLSNLLQGGSGGGGVHVLLPPLADVGGGAGGGALEIGAVEVLTIGPNGQLLASGGTSSHVSNVRGGGGSGGGIRLHSAVIDSAGSIIAKGGDPGSTTTSLAQGGGGRVLIYGFNTTLAVGEDLPDLTPYGINVAPVMPSSFAFHGVVTLSPDLTLVPTGQSLQLGGPPVAVQVASATQPRIELVYRDVLAHRSAELIVPAGGYINSHRIELGGGSASIIGSDPLTNATRGELRGSGTIEVEFINDAGAQVNAINDTLTFAEAATNNAAGQINAINSTLDFQAGLTNDGQLNLINITILGSVTAGSGGAASFVGDNSVGGNLSMATGDSLAIRLGGTTPTQFDSLTVGGDAALAGSLNVSLTGGFTLAPSQSFTIVDIAGTASGGFSGLTEGALFGSFGGTELFITYAGGNGNDVTLFTNLPGDYNGDGHVNAADYVVWRKTDGTPPGYNTWRANFGRTTGSASSTATGAPVPEPATLALVLLSSLCLAYCRCAGAGERSFGTQLTLFAMAKVRFPIALAAITPCKTMGFEQVEAAGIETPGLEHTCRAKRTSGMSAHSVAHSRSDGRLV
jgi:hypothetical protein